MPLTQKNTSERKTHIKLSSWHTQNNRFVLCWQPAIPQHCLIDFSLFPVANHHFKSTHQTIFIPHASLRIVAPDSETQMQLPLCDNKAALLFLHLTFGGNNHKISRLCERWLFTDLPTYSLKIQLWCEVFLSGALKKTRLELKSYYTILGEFMVSFVSARYKGMCMNI